MSAPGVPVDSVALTPVVSWPREAAPGGRYLVIVDLQLNTGTASWPYPDEEYVVGLMLSGRSHLAVSSLGNTSVVLHRFGGTYGPARFVVSVDDAAATGVRTALWLTLISAGGIPFHTAQLPVTVTREAPIRSPAPDVPLARGTAPRTKLPKLTGAGSSAWSMVAVSVNGRPVLALGADDGTLRLWEPAGPEPVTVRIGRGAVRLAPIAVPDGRTLLIAAASATMALIDPATGAVVRQEEKSAFEVTALATFSRPDGITRIAAGTSQGVIYLMDDSRGFPTHARLAGHTGPVFAMATFSSAGSVLLASAGADSAIRLWDAGSGSPVGSMTGHTAQINDITAVRDDRGRTLIASASDDGSLRIWDPSTGKNTGVFTSRGDWINAVAEALGPGRQPVLAWGSRDGALRWSGQLTEAYSTEAGDSRAVTALTPFDWAGRPTLAIARAGGDVELRETGTFAINKPGPAQADPSTLWDIGIVTVLSEEAHAVNAMLATAGTRQTQEHGSGMRFYETRVETAGQHINVVATQALEHGQLAATIAFERLSQLYAPAIVLLVGIAGGIGPAVSPGDVVVATKVISFEPRRTTSSADLQRGSIWQVPAAILHAVNNFFSDHGQPYQASIQDPAGTPRVCRVVPGSLATAGAAAPMSDIRAYLAGSSDQELALDMDAAVLAMAFHDLHDASAGARGWLVIRGIADHADVSKEHAYRETAAWHAAAICMQLLPYLKPASATTADSEDTGRHQERPHHPAGPVPVKTEAAGAPPPAVEQNEGDRLDPNVPELKIGLWGAPASGKSTYLAALTLAAGQAEGSVGQWSIYPRTDTSARLLQDISRTLVQAHAFPEATEFEAATLSEWLFVGDLTGSRYASRRRFSARRARNSARFLLRVIDSSGEVFSHAPEQSQVPQDVLNASLDHLAQSQGLIYLFDPIAERDHPIAADYLSSALIKLGQRMMREGRLVGRFLPHYISVCVTKFDHPALFQQARRNGFVNVGPDGTPRVLDQDAETFFDRLCDGTFWGGSRQQTNSSSAFLRDSIRNYFHPGRIRYYVCSSIGLWMRNREEPISNSPDFQFDPKDFANIYEQDGTLKIRGTIRPINILEPMIELQQRITGN